MSPGKLLSEPSFKLALIEKTTSEKHNYGAVITGLDLNDIHGRALIPLLAKTWMQAS
jgi:hypothetical protein